MKNKLNFIYGPIYAALYSVGALINSAVYGGGFVESAVMIVIPFVIGGGIAGVIAGLLPKMLERHVVLLAGLFGLGFIISSVFLNAWAPSQ